MNTPAHLIFGLAAFSQPQNRSLNTAVISGSLLPDASLYLLTAWAITISDIPAQTVFDELYFSARWQSVFAVDNSFILWGAVLALGLALRQRCLAVFAAAGCLHLAFDFALHNDDARSHFWPVSDWVFHSPVSYWDRAHHAAIVGPLEIGVSLLLCAVLWIRFRNWMSRAGIILLGVAEAAPGIVWSVLI